MLTFNRDNFEIKMCSGDSATLIIKVSEVNQETSVCHLVVEDLITYSLPIMNGEFPLLIDGSKPLKVGRYKYDLFVEDGVTNCKLLSKKDFIVEKEI